MRALLGVVTFAVFLSLVPHESAGPVGTALACEDFSGPDNKCCERWHNHSPWYRPWGWEGHCHYWHYACGEENPGCKATGADLIVPNPDPCAQGAVPDSVTPAPPPDHLPPPPSSSDEYADAGGYC
jgi:hypothetical protein